jgi:DNA primase
MNNNWINFKELRAKLSFPAVLEHYGAKLSEKGGQLVGFCPLPSHSGNKNSPSFSAHPDKGIFQCFGCGGKGNVLDFCVVMDGGNPKRGLDVRKTALKVSKLFNISSNRGETNGQAPNNPPKPTDRESVLVNEPLNFRLKDLDPDHPYLRNRGFSREIMDKFGVGFCSKGVFAGRIAIPLHNNEAELIGYAGRVIDNTMISTTNPKYLFPGKREQEGDIVEFRKSLFLYNGHRFTEPLDDLVLVEGFASVWWLTQCGFPEAVAIMGWSLSPEQRDLLFELTNPQGRIWILADGDKAGKQCAADLPRELAQRRFVKVIMNEGKQPTDYSEEELKSMLGI